VSLAFGFIVFILSGKIPIVFDEIGTICFVREQPYSFKRNTFSFGGIGSCFFKFFLNITVTVGFYNFFIFCDGLFFLQVEEGTCSDLSENI